MIKILLLFLIGLSLPAYSQINISKGTVIIKASGGDAISAGKNGGASGNINVMLSYFDSAKTMVQISGTTVRGDLVKTDLQVNREQPILN